MIPSPVDLVVEGLRQFVSRNGIEMSPAPKPLPGFERYSHVGSYKRPNRHLAEVRETKKPIDALNDSLPLGHTLHPTKGWRDRSERSVKAEARYYEARQSVNAWLATWHPKFKRST